uniref:Uncharacterized protein n=1 Tax=Avena sativa TaxID=4498 RepID=A0ACD5YC17_AVESA
MHQWHFSSSTTVLLYQQSSTRHRGSDRFVTEITSSVANGARMGRRMELTIVFSRAGGLALAVTALAVLTVGNLWFTANNLVFFTLIYGDVVWAGCLLWFQVRWLCLGGAQPADGKLLVLIAVEWTDACFTIGTACAAITVDQFALQNCDTRAHCVLSLVAVVMACAAGALAAVSALGMLWILGCRFRPS